MADTAVAPEVTTPEKKVEEVEKVEKEVKTVEENADEPSVESLNGHSEESKEEEPSENGTAEEAEEKEAESTENGTAEVTATKRKSTGGDEAEAPVEGVSPEKKAKLAEAEETEASNGTVEAEATA